MAYQPGYSRQNDPRNNPFAQNQPQPAPSTREYDADSDLGDHYANGNSSTARLAGSQAYYDQPQYGSGPSNCVFYLSISLEANYFY